MPQELLSSVRHEPDGPLSTSRPSDTAQDDVPWHTPLPRLRYPTATVALAYRGRAEIRVK